MINEYQLGGAVLFSAIDNPYQMQNDIGHAEQQEQKSSTKLVDDKLLQDLIKNGNGMPIDVDNLVQKLADLESKMDRGMPVSKRQILSLTAEINRVARNGEYMKNAEDRAFKNEALDEIAVYKGNYIWVKEKNGKVRPKDFSQITKTDSVLTVSDLITERKYNQSLYNVEEIANTVGQNIGTQKIIDYIQDIVKTIGESENTSEAFISLSALRKDKNGDIRRLSDQQRKDIIALYDVLNTDGVEGIVKRTDKIKQQNMQSAFNYLYTILPKNMRDQLKVRLKYTFGQDISEDEIIKYALLHGNKTSQSVTYSQVSKIDSGGSGNSGSGEPSKKSFYQTPLETLFDGDLNQANIVLSDNKFGNKYGITLKGNTMAAITTDNGKSVSNLPMSIALSSGMDKYLDFSHAFMGNEKITEGKLKNIAYTNDRVATVYMPTLSSGDIDWEGMHGYSQAEAEISAKGIIDPIKKNEIHSKYNSYAQYDQNGNLIPINNTQKYLLTYGYTIDDLVDEDNNYFVTELTGDVEDEISDAINTIYSNKDLKKVGIKGMNHMQGWDDIYKVPIFIKVDDNAAANAYRYAGHGSLLPGRTLSEDMIQEQLLTTPPQMQIQSSGQLLYQE